MPRQPSLEEAVREAAGPGRAQGVRPLGAQGVRAREAGTTGRGAPAGPEQAQGVRPPGAQEVRALGAREALAGEAAYESPSSRSGPKT